MGIAMKLTRLSTRKILRAVLYLRRSTKKKSQEPSIDSQRRACRAWCKKRGIEVVGEFADDGVTAVDSADVRPQFQAMISAANNGTIDFDVVVIWNEDRVSRSDAMMTMAELVPLRKAGIRMATCDRNEPITWTKFEEILLLFLNSNANNQYVRSISKGTNRGMSDVAAEGKWPGSRQPLGYRKGKDGKLTLGPAAEVEVVRWAFEVYLLGWSLSQIAREMTKRGFSRSETGVSNLLRNITYTGDFVWPRSCQAKLYTIERIDQDSTDVEVIDISEDIEMVGVRPKRYKKEKKDQFWFPDNHPAIVDRSVFDAVQRMFARRQKNTTPNKDSASRLAFSNQFLKCVHCDRTMTGELPRPPAQYRTRYQCTGKVTKCSYRTVREDLLMDLVVNTLEDWYLNPETLKRLEESAVRQQKEQAKQINQDSVAKDLKDAEAYLAKLNRKLFTCDEDMEAAIQEEIRKVKAKVDALDAQRAIAATGVDDLLSQIQERAKRAASLIGKLRALKTEPSAFRNVLIQMGVDHIRIDSQKINGKWTLCDRSAIVMNYEADDMSSPVLVHDRNLSWASKKPVNYGVIPLLLRAS